MLNVESKITSYEPLEYAPNPPFGSVHIPIIMWFEIKKGHSTPEKVHIEPLSPLPLSPFCSTLHYGQSIFEGMKAYALEGHRVGIFRPDLHAQRFSNSAKTMAMAEFSPELFMECTKTYVKACKEYVPKEPGHSLYLRPLLLANDPVIKVRSSDSYRFVYMSSIVGPYFNKEKVGSRVLINKSFIRAFPGGTGEAKTSANYALSLQALEYAYSKNFEQVLYVDPIKKNKVEELGGMNFFMVKDEALYTPQLDGQILHGVTRRSILEIAQELGIKNYEQDVLLSDLTSGVSEEIFATGTAASISHLAELGVQDHREGPIKIYKFDKTDLGVKLRNYLMDTHIGKTDLSKTWLHII